MVVILGKLKCRFQWLFPKLTQSVFIPVAIILRFVLLAYYQVPLGRNKSTYMLCSNSSLQNIETHLALILTFIILSDFQLFYSVF